MKILHCPTNTGGNPQGLARAERKLGLDSKLIVFHQNYFEYKTDEVLVTDGRSPFKIELARWKLFFKAFRYDVIHYNFGQSIMPFRVPISSKGAKDFPWVVRVIYYLYSRALEFFDVRIFKLMNKKIFVTYQGDDARQTDYCLSNFKINTFLDLSENNNNTEVDKLKRARIERFSHYADRIYSLNPDLMHVLPEKTKFLPYGHIDLTEWRSTKSQISSHNKPLVVHAPTHRAGKGTRFILDAVDRLNKEGVEFDFKLIEGLSHREARDYYEKADLLIDQLLAGWYGGLAVELMALGKPVICYIREEDLRFIPQEMSDDLPIIGATPDTIYSILKYYLTEGRHQLQELGGKSRIYVEKWHNPLTIAAQLKNEYEALCSQKKL